LGRTKLFSQSTHALLPVDREGEIAPDADFERAADGVEHTLAKKRPRIGARQTVSKEKRKWRATGRSFI